MKPRRQGSTGRPPKTAPPRRAKPSTAPRAVRWKGDPKDTLPPEQYARLARGDVSVWRDISPTLYTIVEPRPADVQAYEWQRRMYAHTGNLVWAWEAYRACRQRQTALPRWLLAAFDSSADGLFDYAQHTRSGSAWRAQLLAALGFGWSRTTADRRRARASRLLDEYDAARGDETARAQKRAQIWKVYRDAGHGGGPHNPVSAWRREGRAAAIASHVRQLVEGQSEDRACAAVAKRLGVSKSSVWRAWRTYLHVVIAGHQRED